MLMVHSKMGVFVQASTYFWLHSVILFTFWTFIVYWTFDSWCYILNICLCAIRYIKTSGNATVDHLSKYLAVRLALEELRKGGETSPINVEAASEKQYTIYIPTANNQFTVSALTL